MKAMVEQAVAALKPPQNPEAPKASRGCVPLLDRYSPQAKNRSL